MSPEAQRIAIAEACGVQPLWSYALPERVIHCDVPDYLSDLNAMAEAEKVLIYQGGNSKNRSHFRQLLQTIVRNSGESENFWGHATAAQRAEAFLKTLGKWTP